MRNTISLNVDATIFSRSGVRLIGTPRQEFIVSIGILSLCRPGIFISVKLNIEQHVEAFWESFK